MRDDSVQLIWCREGLEIQYLLIFSNRKRDLLDKLQKLLALSIEKVKEMVKNGKAKDKEIG